MESESDMPIYIRRGAAVPTRDELLIYGDGEWTIYTDAGPVHISKWGSKISTGASTQFTYLEREYKKLR